MNCIDPFNPDASQERMIAPHRKLLFTIPILLLASTTVIAQNEEDALRISSIMPGGTARSAGLANAFGALGADGSSIAINPAGFGVYRTSELSFTPAVEVNDASSLYYGTRANDTQARFHFSNITLAINNPARNEGDWRGSTYGVSFDRQATNHWRHQAQGAGVPSSLAHHYLNELQQVPPEQYGTAFPFTSSLAWETFALDTFQAPLYPMIAYGATTDQTQTRETRGATSNTSIFYAGNYKDKLYLGLSVGIVSHRFRRTLIHRETNLDDRPESSDDLQSLTFQEDLNTTGNGLDVKVGVIGRVAENFRIGGAFHSPQWLQLNDSYLMEMRTVLRQPIDGQTAFEATSPDGTFNYRLNTPWRAVFSAGYIAGPNGLFSLDYEYADMTKMRFRPSSRIIDGYDFRLENTAIETRFQPVHTIRAGTEWRTGAWYYRAGFSYSTDPYVSDDPRHGQAFRNYAGGVGYRTDNIGVDLAVNYGQRGTSYLPYGDRSLVEPVTADLSTIRTMVTVSFRP